MWGKGGGGTGPRLGVGERRGERGEGGGGDEDPFGDGFDDFDDAPTVISDVVSLPTSDGMGHAGMWA